MHESSSNGTFLFFNTLLLFYIFFLFFHAPHQQIPLPASSVENSTRDRDNFTVWNDCLMNRLKPFQGKPDELWSNMTESIAACEQIDQMKNLPIREFNNSDETKRHILPKLNSSSVIVTLGIGHDTGAEQKLIKELTFGSEFFGADPTHEINEELYSKLPGKYFPFAVGREAGLAEANVLTRGYAIKTVVYVDIIYFLKNILKRTFIDDMWIDAEGAEYGIFPHFYRGGEFDKNGITFCQFNVEVHTKSHLNQVTHDFIFRMLQDKRYAIMRAVKGKHIRLYMLNFENKECVKKYIV